MSDKEDVNNDSEEWVLLEGIQLAENVQVLNSETTCEEVGTEDNPFASQESCSGKEDIDALLSDNLSTNCPETEISDFSDLGSCNQLFSDIEISPVKAYKHCRNEQLNFHLDLLLALAVAAAVGLGTGHFLGWSTKCLEQREKFPYLSSYRNHDLFEDSLKQEPVKGTSKFISQQLQLFHDINHDIRKLDSYETNLNFEGGFVDDLPLNSKNQKHDMIIRFYRNFSFESGNESSETYTNFENKDLQPQNEFITASKNLKNDINKPVKKSDQPIVEESDVKIVKLIKKMHTSILGGEYSSGNPSSQFKNDLSDTVQSIHDLVSNEIIKHVEIKPVSSKDDLKIVGEVYGNFQKRIDQKLTDFENFKNLPFDNIKLYRKKDKVLRKMTNSLVDSVDNLLRLSKKCFAKKQGFLKTEKLVKKSQNIIESLEKKWEKNIKMTNGKQAMRKSESKKQDSKHFKAQDGEQSHFTEQDGEQPCFKKQDGEKSHFKKQNGKQSHFKKRDLKQSHFKGRDTKELYKKHFAGKVLRKQKTDQSQFKKQNPEQTHFKGKDTKLPYFKSKKQ